MFTQSMTSKELADEYRADFNEIDEFNDRVDESESVSNLLRKHRKHKIVSFIRKFKTKRNNRYVGVFIYYRQSGLRKDMVKWKYNVFTVGLMETPKGTAAIVLIDGNRLGVLVQAHFFKRYKERMLKSDKCDWKLRNGLNAAKTIEDMIGIYMLRNPYTALMKPNASFGKLSHLFAPVNDGIALFQFDDKKKLMQANTFVTRDMLSKQQAEWDGDAEEYKRWYAQIMNDTKKLFNTIYPETKKDNKVEDKLSSLHKTKLINI